MSAGISLTQTGAIVQQDPLFADPGSYDFSLQAASPAVGRAGALPERSVDFEEKCYGDPASLGAIEILASGSFLLINQYCQKAI